MHRHGALYASPLRLSRADGDNDVDAGFRAVKRAGDIAQALAQPQTAIACSAAVLHDMGFGRLSMSSARHTVPGRITTSVQNPEGT